MAHPTTPPNEEEQQVDVARWLGYVAVGYVIWIAIFSFAIKLI